MTWKKLKCKWGSLEIIRVAKLQQGIDRDHHLQRQVIIIALWLKHREIMLRPYLFQRSDLCSIVVKK